LKKTTVFVVLLLIIFSCSLEKERTRIKLWTFEGGQRLSILKGLLAKFEYATSDYEIRLKVFPSALSMYRYFMLKAGQGKGPDVLYIPHGWVRPFAVRSFLRSFKQKDHVRPYPVSVGKAVMYSGKTYLQADHVYVPVKLSSSLLKKLGNMKVVFSDPYKFFQAFLSERKITQPDLKEAFTVLARGQQLSSGVSPFLHIKKYAARGFQTLTTSLDRLSGYSGKNKAGHMISRFGRYIVVYGYCVTARTRKPDAAFSLIRFLTSKKHSGRFYAKGAKVSPYKTQSVFGAFRWFSKKNILLPDRFFQPAFTASFQYFFHSVRSGELNASQAASRFLKKISEKQGSK